MKGRRAFLPWLFFATLSGCGAAVVPTVVDDVNPGPRASTNDRSTGGSLPVEILSSVPLAGASGLGPGAETPPPPPPALPELPERHLPFARLPHFYERLGTFRREGGERRPDEPEPTTPLRISWFGDSHTAADFLSDVVRRHLWKRVRPGGPGFVRVGIEQYRHGQAKVGLSGKWRHEPYLPSQRERFGDGVLGYGGERTIPVRGALAAISLKEPERGESVSVSLSARLRSGDGLTVRYGSQKRQLSASDFSSSDGLGAEVSFALAEDEDITFQHQAGSPAVFGAFVERTRPGVVLDTVGINGARAQTFLASEQAEFLRILGGRPVDLVVLAFGTNEAFDKTDLEKYAAHYHALLERFRAGVPGVECLLFGPPDAMLPSGVSHPRVTAFTKLLEKIADSEGCAFLSGQALMGGEGSFHAWHVGVPSLARADRVHLTIKGYEELGRLVGEALLPSGYEL